MTLQKILKKAACNSVEKGLWFIEKSKEQFVSYSEVYHDSIKCGKWLRENGIKTNDSIIIIIKDRKNFVITLWACLIFGYTAIPVDCISSLSDSLGVKNIENVLNSISDVKIVTDDKQYALLERLNHSLKNKMFLFSEADRIKYNEPYVLPKLTNEEYPAIILFTSGSISAPKGIILTEKNIISSMKQVVERVHYNSNDVIINWMSLTHVAGLLLLHLIPIYSGADQVILSPEFLIRYPKKFLNIIARFQGSVTMFPNFAVEFLTNYGKDIDLSAINLCSLRCVFNGAEPINYNNIREFADVFGKCGFHSKAMIAIYGMTEATIALTLHDPDKEEDKFYRIDKYKYFSENILSVYNSVEGNQYLDIAYVGTPVSGIEIKICDENGIEVEAGHIGCVFVKGPNIASKFFSEKEYHFLVDDDNYLDTGDMGCFINGQLIITGRKKNVIFFNGLNFYPEDIENICKEAVGDKNIEYVACAVTNPDTLKDELVIFVESNLCGISFIEKVVKETVSKNISQPVKYVLPVESISRNRIGKKQRYMMKQRFEKGEFNDYIAKEEIYYGKQ